MPLTLVLGPANSAKAGEVLGAFAAASPRGALLVVPTTADADHYQRELAGSGGVLGSVITFSGLAGEIARRTGYSGRRISPFQRDRLLRRVVAQTGFEVLDESAASPGFVAAAAALISELERSLVSAERFAGALRAWASADPRRAAYARDLSALYRGYADALVRAGRVDRDLHMWGALDSLREARGRWGSDAVFFYGFDELTAIERDAVETLARVVDAEVTVSLNYEAGRTAFAARAEAVEELRPLAQRVQELPALDEHYGEGSREALHHLERSLFQAGAERVDPGDAVRLLEAGGERAEAELVAAEVLALLRTGTAADQIAVLCRSLYDTAPVLEQVFAQYGIPVAMARRLPFAHTPLGRGLLALARCAWLEDPPASDLLAYLRSPGVSTRPEVVDRLELEIRCAAVRTAAQARERLKWALGEIDALRGAGDPAPELARQARRLFAAPHRGSAPQLDHAESLDADALAALLRALGEIRELGERPSGPELVTLLEELEIEHKADLRTEAVLIAEPLEIRARRFKAVFVCGLQEGRFPLAGAPEPFLGDERRRELAIASGLRLKASEQPLERERYLFYASVSRATEQLVLSYRSSDEEGNLELPSPFLGDVAEVFVEDWPERRRRRLLADVVWDLAAAPTARERARAEAAAHAPAAGALEIGPRSLSPAALARMRHSELLSAGALESYAECPVKWLVERELSPRPMEPPHPAITRGTYVHDVLEELLRRLRGPLNASSLERANELLAEVLAERPGELLPGAPEALRAAARRTIEADIRRYLAHEAANGPGWQPQDLELRFGFAEEPESLPPLRLGEDGEVLMRGVIDRVDVDTRGRAIVRDYKTGRVGREYSAGNWEKEQRLQVALYMLAVRRLLGLEPVAGLYQPLSGPDLRPRGAFVKEAAEYGEVVGTDGCSEEELEAALAQAERRAVELAARLRSGELAPCPATCSRDGCRYPGICRSQ